MIRRRFSVIALSTTLVILMLVNTPSHAQNATGVFPAEGPIGTIVYVQCPSNATHIIINDGDQSVTIDEVENAYVTITNTMQQMGDDVTRFRYVDFQCYRANGEFFSVSETLRFAINDCPLGDSATATQLGLQPLNVLLNQPQFDGFDIGVEPRGAYIFSDVVTNSAGERLRLNIRSNDPSRLLDYIKEFRFAFDARLVSNADLNDCSSSGINLPNSSSPTTPGMGDITVEMILLTGGNVTRTGPAVVVYAIDPTIERDIYHVYQPIEAFSMSALLRVNDGRAQLTVWDSQNYREAVTLSEGDMSAALDHWAASITDYNANVTGMATSGSEYALYGDFTVFACQPSTSQDCEDPTYTQNSLAMNGIGNGDGSIMNNGHMQVETYCSGLRLSEDDNEWTCGNGRTLQQYDFNRICYSTYVENQPSNRNRPGYEDIFAVPDLGNNIRAYNWRCLVPDGNN